MSYDCKHDNKQLVWADEGACGGRYERRQLRDQCLDCGWMLGEQRPHLLARSTTPEVDKIALEGCIEARRRSQEERYNAHTAAREAENVAWWDRYNSYLASEEWARLRRRILERDGGVCRGCLVNRATQVHHTTYKQVCNEFAFQLVSMCAECHERFHAKAAS
jgi:5-methylcytosine-specific restriction endonuclease McrA